jgi:hypothetical protein
MGNSQYKTVCTSSISWMAYYLTLNRRENKLIPLWVSMSIVFTPPDARLHTSKSLDHSDTILCSSTERYTSIGPQRDQPDMAGWIILKQRMPILGAAQCMHKRTGEGEGCAGEQPPQSMGVCVFKNARYRNKLHNSPLHTI